MIKKEVIPEIGYFLKNRTGSDTEYYERVKNFAEKSCIKVNKVLTFCAKRENSLTTCEIEGVWEKTDNPKRVNFMKRWRNWHKGFIEKELMESRFSLATSQIEDTSIFKKIKKEIAQASTLLNEKRNELKTKEIVDE